MSTPVIRTYQAGDGEGLRALWTAAGFRLSGDDDAGLGRFAELDAEGFLVATTEDGAIAGSTQAAWDGRRGWLHHVAVDPGWRRTGLGTALVSLAEARLRAVGCARVLVLVEARNDAGMAFWEARGYGRRDTHQLARSL